MSNTPSEELRLLLQEARSALWQPANAELCERIDDALARWGTPQPVVRELMTPEQVNAMARKHPAEDLCGWSYRMGIADAEAHYGIKPKGGQQC